MTAATEAATQDKVRLVVEQLLGGNSSRRDAHRPWHRVMLDCPGGGRDAIHVDISGETETWCCVSCRAEGGDMVALVCHTRRAAGRPVERGEAERLVDDLIREHSGRRRAPVLLHR